MDPKYKQEFNIMSDIYRKVPVYRFGGMYVDRDILFIKNSFNYLGETYINVGLKPKDLKELD